MKSDGEEHKSKKRKMKLVIASKRYKNKAKEAKTYEHEGTKMYVPPQVSVWIDDHHEKTLEHLTRGLKIARPDILKAKKSLHLARRIVIKKMLAYSYTDSEICFELDLSGNQLQQYKRALFKEEIEALKHSTPEEQFIQYRHNQMEVIKDLDMLIEKFKATQHLNALSNCLRTKSDILKDISNRAQEMGFMEKKAQEVKIINDIDLGELSSKELFGLVERQQALVQKVSAGNVTSLSEIRKSMKVDK